MSDPLIQLPPLPLSEVNLLLDGLKPMPFGVVSALFLKLHAEATKQVAEQAKPAEA